MDKNWVRERGRRARRRRHWWGGGRRTVARAGRVSVFLVLSCWWGPRHSPAEQRRGARDKGLICGGAHSYSHLYCQCVAVALIILVSLDYHIHVTFYLGNDGVMTRWRVFESKTRTDINRNWKNYMRNGQKTQGELAFCSGWPWRCTIWGSFGPKISQIWKFKASYVWVFACQGHGLWGTGGYGLWVEFPREPTRWTKFSMGY